MELYAKLHGEKHTDRPRSVSEQIGMFYRLANDALGDAARQELVPLVKRLKATHKDGLEAARAFVLTDFAVRRFLPLHLGTRGHLPIGRSLVAFPVVHAGTVRAVADRLDDLTVHFERDSLRYVVGGVVDALEALGANGFTGDKERVTGYLFDAVAPSLEADATRALASRVTLECAAALIAPSRGQKGWNETT